VVQAIEALPPEKREQVLALRGFWADYRRLLDSGRRQSKAGKAGAEVRQARNRPRNVAMIAEFHRRRAEAPASIKDMQLIEEIGRRHKVKRSQAHHIIKGKKIVR